MKYIGRWMNVDPLAEKYHNISLYAYVNNNPLMFIDPKGEEIDFSWIYSKNAQGNYVNQSLVDAFEFFAGSEEGRKFLADYAKKGQTIGGYTFKENGKYHNKKMDLVYKANDNRNRDAGARSVMENGRFVSTIFLSKNGGLTERHLEDMAHESFIHVRLDGKDYYDNGLMDLSSLDKDLIKYVDDYYKNNDDKKGYYPQRANLKQHFQDDRENYLLKTFFDSMKSYYQKKGIRKSDDSIKEELLRGRQISK